MRQCKTPYPSYDENTLRRQKKKILEKSTETGRKIKD